MTLSLIVEPSDLENHTNLRLVDVRKAEQYAESHIPGALSLEPAKLNRSDPPHNGLLPDIDAVNDLLQQLGYQQGEHLVAYDDGAAGSNSAARFIWVLHAYGIHACSWLNGGLHAWQSAGLAVDSSKVTTPSSTFSVQLDGSNVISTEQLLDSLDDPAFAILDARSLGEFAGTDVRATAGGHIPGAQHYEWTRGLDAEARLRADSELRDELADLGITPEKTVIVYCQSHQRSALSYVMLKHLGFKDVRALDGAWSNWGNRDDTPKETA